MCDISVTSVHGSIGLNGHRWLRSDFFTWLEFFSSRISRASVAIPIPIEFTIMVNPTRN